MRWICALLLVGCGPDAAGEGDVAVEPSPDAADVDVDAGAPPALPYAPCPTGERVGRFAVELGDGFTGVQGQVADGVDPAVVPAEAAVDGACRLLRPRSLFCEPVCDAATTCGDDGCVARPTNVDVGTVTVTGLKAPVSMTARAPVFFYTNTDPLEHPGFEAGAELGLEANGAEPFALRGWGITALEVRTPSLPLARGTPARLEWGVPDDAGPARVHLNLNIANHGGTPAWIECEVPDTGAFEIPAELVEGLLDLGFSGFPSVALTRRTADSVSLGAGCVDLLVRSTVVLDVEIQGLVSCDAADQCPEGETCRVDLTCGPME